MAWENLRVDYTDAIWNGLKKYQSINNADGTVSFQDVTVYSNKDKSFFGAKDANAMNEAINTIMSMVENGTDLYTAFQRYFDIQKELFEKEVTDTANEVKTEGDAIVEALRTDYANDIAEYEQHQEELFDIWFNFIKGQLSTDSAGHLQNQVNDLNLKADGFTAKSTTFNADGSITEVNGTQRIVTEFTSDKVITQKLYEGDVLIKTKITTFSADGLTINEEVE